MARYAASLLCLALGLLCAAYGMEMSRVTTATATTLVVTSKPVTDGKIELTVDFTGHFAPDTKVFAVWNDANWRPVPATESGASHTAVVIDPSATPVNLVIMTFKGGDSRLYLLPFKKISTNLGTVMEIIPLPRLELQPAVVEYTSGQDANIMVAIDAGNHINLRTAYTVKKDGKWTPIIRKYISIGEQHEDVTLTKIAENMAKVTAKTSTTVMSGIIRVTVATPLENKSRLVGSLFVEKEIVVKPAAQPGPYPVGFLEFRPVAAGLQCTSRTNCRIGCTAYGSDLSSIRLVVTTPGITQTPEYIQTTQGQSSSLMFVLITLRPGIEKNFEYKCVLTNKKGKTIVQKATVAVSDWK